MSTLSTLCLPYFFSRTVNSLISSPRKSKDLEELSSLGHFLKGSSATLGFNKVKDECEKIQHYGHGKDETGTVDEPDSAKSLSRISDSVGEAKKAYAVVSRLMKAYYAQLEA